MRTKLIEITNHVASYGYKGTWYSTGDRHFVQQDPKWPHVMACRWRALDVAGSIHDKDCREVRGPMAWVRCRLRELRSNSGIKPSGEATSA